MRPNNGKRRAAHRRRRDRRQRSSWRRDPQGFLEMLVVGPLGSRYSRAKTKAKKKKAKPKAHKFKVGDVVKLLPFPCCDFAKKDFGKIGRIEEITRIAKIIPCRVVAEDINGGAGRFWSPEYLELVTAAAENDSREEYQRAPWAR